MTVVRDTQQIVYADESGIHDRIDEKGERHPAVSCMVGGWLGGISQWKQFAPLWREILSEYQVWEDAEDKELGFAFHSKSFFPKISWRSRKSPYKGWSDERATEFLVRLLRTFGRTGVYPIGGIVVNKDFHVLDEDTRRLLTGGIVSYKAKPGQLVRTRFRTTGAPSKPYFAALQILIEEAIMFSHEDTTLHFVFDLQDEYEGGVRQIFEQWRSFKRPGWQRLRGPSFEPKRHYEGLQLADLFCYTVNTSLTERPAPGSDRERALKVFAEKRPAIVLANTNRFGRVVDRTEAEVIRKLREKLAKEEGL